MFVGSRGHQWVKCAQVLFVLLGLLAVSALAQDETAPKAEMFGGISYFHPGGRFLPTDPTQAKAMSGWGTSIYTPFSKHSGGVVDVSGNYGSGNSVHSVMFGAEFKFRSKAVEPFVEGMFGWARRSPKNSADAGTASFLGGGGVDVPISNRFAIRAFRADYIHSFSNPEFSRTATAQTFWNSLRIQSGIVMKFGVPTVERVATVACFADPSKVKVGEPVSAKVTPSGFAHRRHLTYEWQMKDTTLSSTAASAVIETASLAPGDYTIKATASDRAKGKRHETATCSATFAVLAIPAPEAPAVSEAPAAPESSAKPEANASAETPATAPEAQPQQPTATAETAQTAPSGATAPAETRSGSNADAQPATAPVADKHTSSREEVPAQSTASNESQAAPQAPAANTASAVTAAPETQSQQPTATAETTQPGPSRASATATSETPSASPVAAQPATAPAEDKQPASPETAPAQSTAAPSETQAAQATAQAPVANTAPAKSSAPEAQPQQPSATTETTQTAPSGATAPAETQSGSNADAQPATAPVADKHTSSREEVPAQSTAAPSETQAAQVTPQAPVANTAPAKSSAPETQQQQPTATAETTQTAPSGATVPAETQSGSSADVQPATAPVADKHMSSQEEAPAQPAASNESQAAPQAPAANTAPAVTAAPEKPAQQTATANEAANTTKALTPKTSTMAPARSEQSNNKRVAKSKTPETAQPSPVAQLPDKQSTSKAPQHMAIVATPATVVSGDPVTITVGTATDKTSSAPICKTSTGTLHVENGVYTLDTAGAKRGKISVTCTDGEGRPVGATLIEVIAQAKPNAQVRKLNSLAFNNARRPARVDNVAKQILRDAAHALQQSEPGSKLILVGNARATELEANKDLAAQRTANAKAFLMDRQNGGGVDASSISVQTGKVNARRVDIYLAAPGTTADALNATVGVEGTSATNKAVQHRHRRVVEK